jgi:hypothetical protein
MEEAREREPDRQRESGGGGRSLGEEEEDWRVVWGEGGKGSEGKGTEGRVGQESGRRGVIYMVTVTFPATSPTDSSLEGLEQCFLARFGDELNMNLKFLTLFLKYFWLPT